MHLEHLLASRQWPFIHNLAGRGFRPSGSSTSGDFSRLSGERDVAVPASRETSSFADCYESEARIRERVESVARSCQVLFSFETRSAIRSANRASASATALYGPACARKR